MDDMRRGGRAWGMGATWRRDISITAARIRADIAFAVIDVFIVVAAYTVGLGIRMLDPGVMDPVTYFRDFAPVLPLIVVIHLVANVVAGAYGHVWEHASVSEAIQVVLANAASGVILMVTAVVVRDGVDLVVPYTAIVLGAVFSAGGMGLVRFRSRLFSLRRASGASNVFIVGDGLDAALFARRLSKIQDGGRIVGFVVDDSNSNHSVKKMAGYPIVGMIDEIGELAERYDADEVVVIGNDPRRTREVVDRCLDVPVRLRIAPAVGDVMHDRTSSLDVRDISVDDILVRPPVAIDLEGALNLIQGRRVLVTGAGGSIGSEIVRQILRFDPGSVWALDRDETLLHEAGLTWGGDVQHVLCDIRDANALISLLAEIRPEIVFHAGALKHVPLLEANPEEAVLTNVIGTRNVIEAGSRAGMKHFILISTDKAVNPSSVMGSTKRIAELMTQAGTVRGDGCVYSAVRFGNVLGSRGSVVPTFVEQIRRGGPVTVTDPDMTRYFMTVDEAARLVVQAATLARGSEVFLLDMGEPVKIVDLARRMIRLAGLLPDRDIEITYTGRRPGEKLFETLANGVLNQTEHPKIFDVELESVEAPLLFETVADLEEAATQRNRQELAEILARLTSALSEENVLQVVSVDVQPAAQWS